MLPAQDPCDPQWVPTMRTVSVINYKGGVGKPTIVANLAAELGWRGHRVLLIDLDPQASLTFSFVSVDSWATQYADSTTIRDWYHAYIDQDQNLELASLIVTPPRVNRRIGGCVDLICSHLSLINIDLELATRLGGASLRQARTNFLRLHSRLLEGLQTSSIKDKYDYVIIDCPPNFNIVTKTAIVASDRILVPAIPDSLSTLGIQELQRHVGELVSDFNEYATLQDGSSYAQIAPTIMGVIPTMVQIYGGQPIRTQRQFINRIRQAGMPLFASFVRRNNSVHGNAPLYGTPVVLDGSASVREIRHELEQVATEFIARL